MAKRCWALGSTRMPARNSRRSRASGWVRAIWACRQRACMQKGDADAAIAWLKSIPTRFLPLQVQDEAVFAPALGPCHPERQRGILSAFPVAGYE